MGLTPAQVGAAVRRTARALRAVQSLSARAFLASVWTELGGTVNDVGAPSSLVPAALALSGVAERTLAKVLGGTAPRRPTYVNAWKRLPRTALFILHDDTHRRSTCCTRSEPASTTSRATTSASTTCGLTACPAAIPRTVARTVPAPAQTLSPAAPGSQR